MFRSTSYLSSSHLTWSPSPEARDAPRSGTKCKRYHRARPLRAVYISGLKERQTPALPDWRHNNNANLELQENAAFSIAARQNNNGGTEVYTSRDVQKVGGGVRWASPPGFVHTSFTIVPPGELREKHPEWFGETQLCWTNRSLIAFVIGRVKGYLEADPNATVISVTQNDGGSACRNAEEDRVAKEEGSDAGPLLRAVNSIADAIKDEHPSVVVETLAYTYTRKAPKLTRPRPNVVIRLSNIECDFFHPLSANTSAGANPAFVADLKAWHVISNRTWIWTYVTDFSNWMMPWPDYFTMEANIQFYIEHGVTGVYQEGQYMAYGGDLQALKSWLGMKLMWNPYRNTSDLISQFAHGYYGSVAAPFVLRHIEIFVDSAANSSSMFLSEGVSYTSSYLSPAACIDALTNIKEAEVKVSAAAGLTNVSTTLARLKAIEYGTLYVVLLRWDEMKAWAAANNRTWPAGNASKQEMLTQFTSHYRHTHMDVRIGFDPTVPLACNKSASGTCFVLDQKVQPPSCGLACAMVPCLESGVCDLDCGLSEGCHGIDWFTNAVLNGPSPPPSAPTGPPGTRSFPDCHGYDCGPGSTGASPATAYGDRCFAPGGGSSQLGPFVCCNASVPGSMHAKMPCTLSQNVHGCWWPISVGCPGVPPGSVCPLRLPYQYGSDEAGWYCCATDVGPRMGACAGSCCLTAGSSSGCQGRPKCYNETVGGRDV